MSYNCKHYHDDYDQANQRQNPDDESALHLLLGSSGPQGETCKFRIVQAGNGGVDLALSYVYSLKFFCSDGQRHDTVDVSYALDASLRLGT